ncbi:MAG: hypothetical protein P8X80_06020 [Desulfobacterales bacterium]
MPRNNHLKLPNFSATMSKFKKSFHIKGRDFIRAGEASINVQNLLKSMDFDPRLIRRVAICGYESEMNVVMHGGEGSLSLEVDTDKLILEISDDGPVLTYSGIRRDLTSRAMRATGLNTGSTLSQTKTGEPWLE